MLLKTSNGKPIKFFYLTKDMLDVLVSQAIPLQDVFKISAYDQKLTENEIAGILKFQTVVADKLSSHASIDDSSFGEGFHGQMIKQAFNAIGSESLREVYTKTKCFSSIEGGLNTVIIVFHDNETETAPEGCLVSKTFSGALLETIFARVGYLEAHYGKAVKPVVGEFSLADVYKLVGIENA